MDKPEEPTIEEIRKQLIAALDVLEQFGEVEYLKGEIEIRFVGKTPKYVDLELPSKGGTNI